MVNFPAKKVKIGDRLLWQVDVRWESDRTITRYGEELSTALRKLSQAVYEQEVADAFAKENK